MSTAWPEWFEFERDGSVSQRTLDYWRLSEVEFALALTAFLIGVVLLLVCLACGCYYACCRRPPEQKYADEAPPPEPIPEPVPFLPAASEASFEPWPEPEPEPEPEPTPKQAVYDGGEDKIIAVNGRPVSPSGHGLPLPYTPANITLVVTPNAPPVGAVLLPSHTEEDLADAGGGAYSFVDEQGMGMRAAAVSGALEGAARDDSMWEADKIFNLEERVRALESQLAAARSGGALTTSPSSLPGVPSQQRGRSVASAHEADRAVQLYYAPTPQQDGMAAGGMPTRTGAPPYSPVARR